jgi:hypothetical protein
MEWYPEHAEKTWNMLRRDTVKPRRIPGKC